MSGRGKGGKGLGKGGAKRHRKVLRDNIQGERCFLKRFLSVRIAVESSLGAWLGCCLSTACNFVGFCVKCSLVIQVHSFCQWFITCAIGYYFSRKSSSFCSVRCLLFQVGVAHEMRHLSQRCPALSS